VLLEQAIPEVSHAIYSSRDTILAETARQLKTMAGVLNKLQSDYQMLANGQIQLTGQFVHPVSAALQDNSISTTPITVLGTSPDSGPPTYTLVKACTVSEIWREWNKGILGGPAVKDLELK
jgi:Transcriptional activator of glycolytic enzymes